MEQKGWVYSIMIDYQELVKMPEFEGHTTRTLCKIYFNMLECARKKFEMPTQRDVTVHQVTDKFKEGSTYFLLWYIIRWEPGGQMLLHRKSWDRGWNTEQSSLRPTVGSWTCPSPPYLTLQKPGVPFVRNIIGIWKITWKFMKQNPTNVRSVSETLLRQTSWKNTCEYAT